MTEHRPADDLMKEFQLKRKSEDEILRILRDRRKAYERRLIEAERRK